ncbi:GNAT family N-acetyltransferase [Lentisphaerota bacterium ZTH]|nr:GNAT family N-acetyltransferase [Lentisphaerota bacterium]WET07061.1 GNAT family N-acetyltransferase [Lentisphaerota bacterium ZTH]
MVDHVNIRVLNTRQVETIVDMAKNEGWNPGINDARAFHLADPNGFFGIFCGSKLLGTVSSINYDDFFSFIGCLIVAPEFRNGRIGYMLGRHAMEYAGTRNIAIDGVLGKIHAYENFGFKLAYRNCRMQGIKTSDWPQPQKKYGSINEIPFDELLDYDLHCFPAPRPAFLSFWTSMNGAYSCAVRDDHGLQGYGTIRKCWKGYRIGPLFADNVETAENLLLQLVSTIETGEAFCLDIPTANAAAEILAVKYKMQEVFATARMYTLDEPPIDLQKVFGVTSFELG